jgi:hypothetical protein
MTWPRGRVSGCERRLGSRLSNPRLILVNLLFAHNFTLSFVFGTIVCTHRWTIR